MERTRRALLGLCAGGLIGLAGCGSGTVDEGDTPNEDDPTDDPESAAETTTAGGSTRPTVAPAETVDVGASLDGANGYDGATVDARGEATVTVDVGAGMGGLGFDPAAVRVDPGTTIQWAWTGDGGAHNVVGEGDAIDSGSPSNSEERTYEESLDTGVYRYYCAPHRRQGMKGVVVVGDP